MQKDEIGLFGATVALSILMMILLFYVIPMTEYCFWWWFR